MATAQPEPERRAKRKRTEDDLEERYMQRIQEEEVVENKKIEAVRKAKQEAKAALEEDGDTAEGEDEDSGDDSDGGESEDEQQNKNDKKGTTGTGSSELFPIRHETLEPQKHEDFDEAARTVFLGNVPSIAISSKSSYKILKSVFSAPGKIFKLRFRSIAFSEQIPRKAAFATHKLHEKQQTVNAYVVYQTKEAAREALKLNGSVVLDRHIRVDSVAHPAKHDTQRSVFIGNLDFEAQEESLWRHFAPCGTIEYVRIVRDGATNVGKGFAYVQFEDVVSVEQALLLDGRKMQNDRKLRVSRAKAVKRKNKPVDVTGPSSKKQKVFVPRDNPRQKEMLGRARRLLGKAGAAKAKKAPESFIFEGTRATVTANPRIKLGGKKKGKPARARANARSSAWKQKAKKK
ncbi:RNA-binding domain-containing protein [Terfezia boudieri ATCC MYA-4762]|uniref:Nucleolar protein 12 n=1 Tax=Terfezia boudieri ATCC MYA-4762 TaxID=1051890 RepID=A0A3N4LPJ2_9PEZI|nr:RNA-binding domain-containing protein [Terfezia boudieri ATCC MYA-4762]